ncbi:MAG TPA: hypothetical protein VE690_05970 [Rhodopila sp.]|nr:hypothetical protein [Rhodopila sp.]
MTREEILSRYRALREISRRHHTSALELVAADTMIEHAKRLGLAVGRTLVLDSPGHDGAGLRSRRLHRQGGPHPGAGSLRPVGSVRPGSDEALVLDAMRQSRVSIWRIDRHHDAAGLILSDMLRETEAWLMDEHLETSVPDGTMLGGRIYKPESFAMTAGAMVPVTSAVVQELAFRTHARDMEQPDKVTQDPRFAATLYRAAIESGVMDRVRYE